MRYSFFYTSNIYKNVYALLSPFTLKGWFIVILSFYLVCLVLWLTVVNNNPFFWLTTVFLEQNSHKWRHINSANMFLIAIWLYACHVFRNAYTSNLYSFMTLELEPSDIPSTFEEIVNWDSVTLLSYNVPVELLIGYMYGFSLNPNSVPTKSYNLSQLALQKNLNIYIDFDESLYYVSIKHKGEYIYFNCFLSDLAKFRSEGCKNLEKFAYLTISGSLDYPDTYLYSAGKLMLLMANTNLKIVDYNEDNLYSSRNLIYSTSDHIFRSEIEKYTALILESGIEYLLTKYLTEIKMRDIFVRHDAHLGKGNKSISRYVPLWIKNGCFTSYSKAKCDVNFAKDLEVPVKLIDLLAVWIINIGSLAVSVLLFLCERI